MRILITIIRVIILSPLLLPHFLYTTIRDLLFPEIGIYKANLFAFKIYYHHWRSNNPVTPNEEFPIGDALSKTLYTRYPSWTTEQRADFIEKNHITSVNSLIYAIAQNELSDAVFERYKKRYSERKE